MSTNLASGNWLDTTDSNIDRNCNDPDDPKRLRVICPLIPENDSEDDPTKISARTRDTRNNAIGKWVNVRNQCEIGAIASFEEECHTGHEAEHCGMRFAVHYTDRNQEPSTDDSYRVQPDFLAPDRTSVLVDEIGKYATERSEHDVQKTEHRGPSSSACLAELGEVLEVVCA